MIDRSSAFVIASLSVAACFAQSTQPVTATPYDAAIARVQALQQSSKSEPFWGYHYDEPITPAVVAFLERERPTLDLIRQAARQPAVQWPAVETGADIQAVAQRAGELRELKTWMLLRSEWHLSGGRPAEAAADVLAVMAMGRHVSQQPMVLSTYAGSGFFDHGLHRLAELLPRLPAEQVNALPVAINALPVAPPLHEVLKSELTFGNKLAAPDGIPPEAIEPLATFYGDITRSKATSRDAFKKILEAAVAKLPESERVMAADEGMVESGQRLWDLSARSEARKAMLYTAVQIVTRGEAAVAESSDPFGGKPFGFRRTPDGFILTSALTSGHPKNPVTSDKAIELVVGKSAAQ